jgi:hypothetical protein
VTLLRHRDRVEDAYVVEVGFTEASLDLGDAAPAGDRERALADLGDDAPSSRCRGGVRRRPTDE